MFIKIKSADKNYLPFIIEINKEKQIIRAKINIYTLAIFFLLWILKKELFHDFIVWTKYMFFFITKKNHNYY
jgi:hypothetical protein